MERSIGEDRCSTCAHSLETAIKGDREDKGNCFLCLCKENDDDFLHLLFNRGGCATYYQPCMLPSTVDKATVRAKFRACMRKSVVSALEVASRVKIKESKLVTLSLDGKDVVTLINGEPDRSFAEAL